MVSDTRRRQHHKAWPGPFAFSSSYHSSVDSWRSDSWKLRQVKRGAKKLKRAKGRKVIGGSSPLCPAHLFFSFAPSRLSECSQKVKHPDSVAAVNSSPLHGVRWKGGSALLPINPQPDDQYLISVGRKLLIFLLMLKQLQ